VASGGLSRVGRSAWRLLAGAGYPLAGLVLTLVFIFVGFPYDLLGDRISARVEADTSLRLRIGGVSPHLGLRGLGLAARDVHAQSQGGPEVTLEKLVLRPAWSSSWLSGIPALHLDLKSELGTGSGTLLLGESVRWQGALHSVQIAPLLVGTLQDGFDLEGTLDADMDLEVRTSSEGGGLFGHIHFDLQDGSFSGPGLPMSLPFESLGGDLRFGDDATIRVEGVKLEGPIVAATLEGTIGDSPVRGHQPLDLQLAYEIRDKTVVTVFGRARGRGKISGTLQKPVLQ
jgi:type II secretion system protein N